MEIGNFAAFISYFEENGKEFAELIRNILEEKRSISAFVAHIERGKYSDDFSRIRKEIIQNSKLFIFINTVDSLTRPQIIEEFSIAYPKGYVDYPELIIFRHAIEGNPRGTTEFMKKTGLKYDIAKHNQIDFQNLASLSTAARILFDNLLIKENNKENLSTSTTNRITKIFFGRRKEIEDLENLLNQKNIISIVGIGGVGKSSLIGYFLDVVKNNFSHTITLSLSKNTTLDMVIEQINQKINYISKSKEELLEKFATLNAVIHIDNYEVISDGIISRSASQQEKQLHDFFLSLPRNIKTLVSSKNVKNIEGETIYRLEGLNYEDGIDLFLSLIQSAEGKKAKLFAMYNTVRYLSH